MRLLVCAALALGAAPAHADELDYGPQVDIVVSGVISPRCGLGSVGDMDFGDLTKPKPGFRQRVALDCNIPFTMTIVGQSGALANTRMPQGQGPYAGTVPYAIGIELPVRHPAPQTISRTFASHQLRAGGSLTTNGGIATDDMYLAVEVGTPTGQAGLLAGEYSETITITISPS